MKVHQSLQNLFDIECHLFWFQLLPFLEQALQVCLTEFHDESDFRPARACLWHMTPAEKSDDVAVAELLQDVELLLSALVYDALQY